jgi:hypothetical protein
MVERNPCKEAGCEAACCFGSWFNWDYTEKEIRHFFPTAKKVSYSEFNEELDPGVYFYTFLGVGTARIVGRCPHLSEENICLIHDNLPPDCSNLAISSRECSKFRRPAVQQPK